MEPNNPLEGKTFLSMERLVNGWVARRLTFSDGEIEVEMLNEPGSYKVAYSRYIRAYRSSIRKENTR